METVKDEQENAKSIRERIRLVQEALEETTILKTTEGYGYDYADLPTIMKAVTPLLKKNNIWYSHRTGFDNTIKQNFVYTEIYCTDDEDDLVSCTSGIDPEAVLGGMNRFQVEGSAITYFRRYHIVTLLGLTTEEDTDAGGKRKTKPQKSGQKTTSKTSDSNTGSTLDFVEYFKVQVEKKTKEQINKILNMYKEQINNDDLKAINKIIKDKYGD